MNCNLEQWALVEGSRLSGIVTGHRHFENGSKITTSRIQCRKGDAIFTRNSHYTLGVAEPAYEAMFPDAKNRLFNVVPDSAL